MITLPELYELYVSSQGQVFTDTRQVKTNAMFFALKGANFNGNTFALKAIEMGASYAIVDEPIQGHENIIQVEDVLKTLQDLAHYHRKQLGLPVIAIGGSNGKTTTKELLVSILTQAKKVHFTPGNFNNHIGLPLTILQANAAHELIVLEMGANKAGDMTELCLIAEPNYGIITNIGKEHLEGFGGIEGVAASEGELFDYLASSNGHAFVNQDDEWVKKLAQSIHSQSPYAMNDGVLQLKHHVPNIVFDYQSVKIASPLMGLHNFQNIRACVEIARTIGLNPLQIQAGIQAYVPQNNRSQWVKGEANNTILLDAYNANPSSVEMALKTFAAMPGSKWVLLGDMFELGAYEASEHQAICDLAFSLSFEHIVLVGKAFAKVHLPHSNMKQFESVDQAQVYINEQKPSNQLVLIKGSRGMKMELFKDLF